MKRRYFLKATALAATATAIAPQTLLASQVNSTAKKKVIILGGGIAGLGAAYRLQQLGLDFTVIEGRKRLGGRIFTHTIDPEAGQTIELGAEWIGNSHTQMRELCKALNIKLVDHRFETHLLLDGQHQKPGAWSLDPQWERSFKQQISDFNEKLGRSDYKDLDRVSWRQYLQERNISERDLEVLELFHSTDFGEDIRHVSAYAALSEYAESSEKNEMDWRIEGGNSRLIEALVSTLGSENLYLEHEVISIQQRGAKVTVGCANGTSFEADAVICTLPTWALSRVIFDPPLPPNTREALSALQYSRIIKTSVLYRERFWNDEAFDLLSDTLPQYFFHSTKNQAGNGGVLTSYAVGDRAYVMSKYNDTQKIQAIDQALKPVFGATAPLAQRVVSYYWGTDRYTQGAYAFYGRKQWFDEYETLQRRFRKVYFAGEHLADWQGFMEGALQTGYDAAEAIA
ncbi:flavin monoamine oxidase family protein [Eisenibacter elegans]|jgi:monoamine oxidase|uniref:flavin monoamine oxidase family protein n=1 Tax=Eisenibacter elegans TaxID=997 RepID=UPI000419D11E|nr:NAD(P)/FAD-dependent oxidoreductase [Eisenibacter elegans]